MKQWAIVALALSAALLPATAMAMDTPPGKDPGKPKPGSSSSGGSSGGPAQVPEPASMLVLAGGLGALGLARKAGRPKR